MIQRMDAASKPIVPLVACSLLLGLAGCAQVQPRPGPLPVPARTTAPPSPRAQANPAPGVAKDQQPASSPGTPKSLQPLQAQDIKAAPAGASDVKPASLAEAAPVDPERKFRQLYDEAAKHYAGMDSYIVRFRRREFFKGKENPEEVILMKFRKEPWSVYMKWVGKAGEGREVAYVKNHYDNQIHTLVAAGDSLFVPAGKRISLPIDNPLVKNASRHSVSEAGIGSLIDRFGRHVSRYLASAGKNETLLLRYLGPQKRAEFADPVEIVEQRIPKNEEQHLPGGGVRLWFFDSASKLPSLIITYDETGREVEYYCYDHLQFPVRLDDNDFNPDKLWANKK